MKPTFHIIESESDFWVTTSKGDKTEVAYFFYDDEVDITDIKRLLKNIAKSLGVTKKVSTIQLKEPFKRIGDYYQFKSPLTKVKYNAGCEGECLRDFLSKEGYAGLKALKKHADGNS